MPLSIDYESEGFEGGGPVTDGPAILQTSWDDLLWAAVTVGRPNRQYVFRYGATSVYEALFRWSLVRMALEQKGPSARRLWRTAAARSLDPSEKGAVSYFLGLTMCKLFAAQLLKAPWLLHLDVFRPQLDSVLFGRSRPDLVGMCTDGGWVALESKGRVSAPDKKSKEAAKEQAKRLVSVNGSPPAFSIGGIAYFKDDVLRFYWRDPVPDHPRPKLPIEISVGEQDWWHHYAPLFELIVAHPQHYERMLREPVLLPIESADVEVGIQPEVLRHLTDRRALPVQELSQIMKHPEAGPLYKEDGVAVVAGESWFRPLHESWQS